LSRGRYSPSAKDPSARPGISSNSDSSSTERFGRDRLKGHSRTLAPPSTASPGNVERSKKLLARGRPSRRHGHRDRDQTPVDHPALAEVLPARPCPGRDALGLRPGPCIRLPSLCLASSATRAWFVLGVVAHGSLLSSSCPEGSKEVHARPHACGLCGERAPSLPLG
jgi:hypothetical protein